MLYYVFVLCVGVDSQYVVVLLVPVPPTCTVRVTYLFMVYVRCYVAPAVLLLLYTPGKLPYCYVVGARKKLRSKGYSRKKKMVGIETLKGEL